MKSLGLALLAATLAMTGSAFASTNAYDLKMDLSLNGKHVSSPHVIAKEGKPATITQENSSNGHFIEVIATEGSIQNHKGILMKFVVGTIGKNGERTIISRPQVVAKEGEPAKITQSDSKNGAEYLSLSVTAKKTTL